MITESIIKAFLKLFVYTLIGVLISSCSFIRHSDYLGQEDLFRGKVSISNAGERWSFRYRWFKAGDHSILDLWNLVGVLHFKLESHGSKLVIVGLGEKRVYSERSLQDYLGFEFPQLGMIYWMRGAPMPSEKYFVTGTDINKRVVSFEQLGWHVAYTDYIEMEDGIKPRQILVTYEETKIKMTIET